MGKNKAPASDSSPQWPVKYRPQTLEDMILSSSVRERAEHLITHRNAQTILISGRTGSGKTTLARIMAWGYARVPYGQETQDILEMNIGDKRTIDDVRRLEMGARYLPTNEDGRRVFILDEFHAATGQAASALLKPLEEPSKHAVWILATDQPQKLQESLANRCFSLHLENPSHLEVRRLLIDIVRKEKVLQGWSKEDREDLVDACVAASDNVPRAAIQRLQEAVISGEKATAFKADASGSLTVERRKAASLIVLCMLLEGQGQNTLETMMTVAASRGDGELLDPLQTVTSSLLIEQFTGQRQTPTYFFNRDRVGMLQDVNVEHLEILLRHLVNARTSAAADPADARSPLINALLCARREIARHAAGANGSAGRNVTER